MSVKAMTWAFEQRMKPARKCILLALADAADDSGKCWPGAGRIAYKACVSKRTVLRTIKEFEAAGLLAVERRYNDAKSVNDTNLYWLNLSYVAPDPDPETPGGGDTVSPGGSDTQSPGVVTQCHQGSDTVSPGVGRSCVTRGGAQLCHPNRKVNRNKDSNDSMSDSPDGDRSTTSEQPDGPKHPGAVIETPGGEFWGYEPDLAIAREIFEAVDQLSAGEAKSPPWARWANDVRLMRFQDDRTSDQIRRLFNWAIGNHFWRQQVHSPAALRRHWTKLAIQFNEERARSHGQTSGSSSQRGGRADVRRKMADIEDTSW